MKRFIFLFLGMILLPSLALAQVMRQVDLTFDVENENTVNVEMFFKFSEEIKKVNVPIEGTISNIETDRGSCSVIYTVQQILQCEPPSPFIVGDWSMKTKFTLDGATKKQGNITQFSFDMPVLWETDKMSVTTRLPVGYAVSENVVLPTSPSGAFVLLEGKRATVRWNFENIEEGNIIPIRVHYEAIGPFTFPIIRQNPLFLAAVLVLLVVGVGLIGLIYIRTSRRRKVVLSVLNENERIVISILQKQKGEIVDQRKIVQESGFSKAKVTRILQSLQDRGLVETERIGRKNRVKLKRKLLEE